MSIDWLTTWTMVMASSTAVMAIAVGLSAIFAYKTIKTTKNIDKDKLNFKVKSISKNLLLEVNENTFIFDYLLHELEITEIKFNKYKEIEHIKHFYEKLKFEFINEVYKIFQRNMMDVDFNNEKIIVLLREHYSKLDLLNKKIKFYNSIDLNEKSFEFKRHIFDQINTLAKFIKKKKLNEEIFINLIEECGYDLRKDKLYYKKFDLSHTDILNELIKIGQNVKVKKKIKK